jgi:[ribosomal protein S5]-alanine N-acetyltransferase
MKILETERLILRRLQPSDLGSLQALYGDPEIRRYFPDGTLTLEQTREELDWFVAGDPDHPELGLWATVLKESGEFIGRCGLLPWTIGGVPEVEVAYMISRSFWNRGLGSEAAKALVRYGFDRLGLARVIALIHPENEASMRTAVKAGLGFEREIELGAERVLLYAISRTGTG